MKHNIYLLVPTDYGDNKVSYGCYAGHVIIADSPEEARKLCPDGDEGIGFWEQHEYATCKKIGESTRLGKKTVLSSFISG